jgi:anti-sigma B factor antagonist
MPDGDRSTVRFEGDLDIVTSEEMKRQLAALLEPGKATVVVDLHDVGFVDSSGLGALVALHHFAEARGSRFVICDVPPHVQDLLTLTRLDKLLTVE